MQQLATASGGSTSSTTVEGHITIQIGQEMFTLEGTVGEHIIVSYHRDFMHAANLGNIFNIIKPIAGAFGLQGSEIDDFNNNAKKFLDSLDIPALQGIYTVLEKTEVRITDLEINTLSGVYQFGFGLDFSAVNIAIGNISVKSFGMKITYMSGKE